MPDSGSACVHVCKADSVRAIKKHFTVDTGISKQIRNKLSTQVKAFLWALELNLTAGTHWRQDALPLSINKAGSLQRFIAVS